MHGYIAFDMENFQEKYGETLNSPLQVSLERVDNLVNGGKVMMDQNIIVLIIVIVLLLGCFFRQGFPKKSIPVTLDTDSLV